MNFYFLYSFFPSYLFVTSCFWSVLQVVDLRSISWVVEHEERTRQIQEKWTLVQDPEPGDGFREACAFGLFHFGEVGVYGIIAGGSIYFMEVNIWAGGHMWDFFFLPAMLPNQFLIWRNPFLWVLGKSERQRDRFSVCSLIVKEWVQDQDLATHTLLL